MGQRDGVQGSLRGSTLSRARRRAFTCRHGAVPCRAAHHWPHTGVGLQLLPGSWDGVCVLLPGENYYGAVLLGSCRLLHCNSAAAEWS